MKGDETNIESEEDDMLGLEERVDEGARPHDDFQ